MEKQKCIIYGGGGFIGSHLCDSLLEKGYGVIVFDKLNFSKKNLSHSLDKIKIIEGDFNNEIDLANSLKNVDYVFHLVSSTLPATSNDNPVYDAETNLISSLKLFRECVNNKIKKVIFLSSGGTVYGIPQEIPVKESFNSNPICSYGIIKKAIEEYLMLFNKIYGLEFNIFRLSNPYGERQNPLSTQGAISVFINKAIHDEPIEIWGDGETVRDYLYIKDATEALAQSPAVNSKVKIFNLSSSSGVSLNGIIEMIEKISCKKLKIIYKEARSIDVPVSILDNELVRKNFNWQPETGIEEGIMKTYNYIKKNY